MLRGVQAGPSAADSHRAAAVTSGGSVVVNQTLQRCAPKCVYMRAYVCCALHVPIGMCVGVWMHACVNIHCLAPFLSISCIYIRACICGL